MTEAIIILANLMESDGTLNNESSARLATGMSEARNNINAKIIFPGWAYREDSPITIADAYKHHAIQKYAIHENRIFTETNSRDTVGDAFFTKKNIINPHQLQTFTVVSSSYHIPRCKIIFEFIYGPDYKITYRDAPQESTEKSLKKELQSIDDFHSTFRDIEPGDTNAIQNRLYNAHPFYNGEVYPKIFT